MAVSDLLSCIEQRLAEIGISERKACMKAREINPSVGLDFVRDMRRRNHSPKADKLAALAQAINLPPETLLAALGDGDHHPALAPSPLTPVRVKGAVQAGAWHSAIEFPLSDQYTITSPANGQYAACPRYGLLVRGASMNQMFPDGTVVEVVNFSDLGRKPQDGECVVAIRRDGIDMEATLKIVQLREDGSAYLWPRSTDPEWQTPIRLGSIDEAMRHYSDFGERSDGPDTEILALVVWAHQPVGKWTWK